MRIGNIRLGNSTLILLIDAVLVVSAWFIAYWLRFNLTSIPTSYLISAVRGLPWILLIQFLWYLKYELYRADWRYISVADVIRIIKAVVFATAVAAVLLYGLLDMQHIPRSVLPLYAILTVGFLGGARVIFRRLKETSTSTVKSKRVLIIGAGQAGESLVRELLRQRPCEYLPVAFVDERRHRVGRDIHGVRIIGQFDDLPKLIKQSRIDLAIIALPTVNAVKMRQIVELCEQSAIPFRILPNMHDVAAGHVDINLLRDVRIEDLLGREEVSLEWDKISHTIKDSVVLVSGGGGSIGSELCRQIAKMQPEQLILLDNSEFSLYRIDMELRQTFPQLKLQSLLVNVTDGVAVLDVMQRFSPDLVFHAAAYKHVPILEGQIRAAVKNNVIGSRVMAEAASTCGVKQFVLISTDKVVNPVNIMGASKRIAEIFCQNLNRNSATQFITVRFGNVLGSTGSVVPLFKKQLDNGGPLTVTHPEITRYFMTIPEAAQLILQAIVIGRGGEIFVLDMGEPVKIRYLAEQMIQLAGKKVNEDVEIVYTGLRPGEKLYEELFHENEHLTATQHAKILQAYHREIAWEELVSILDSIGVASEQMDEEALLMLLAQLVPEYKNLTAVPIQSAVYTEDI